MIPVALTIAGSDCSAGAGLQADLKTFQHFHVYGLTAATCVVSETPNIVHAIHALPSDMVLDQVQLLLDSYPVAAIKTGMLHSRANIEGLADLLQAHLHIPLVVDPVMIASTGDPLIEADAIAAYQERLLPMARIITPNVPEAEFLWKKTIGRDNLSDAARELSALFGCAVLLKGGHLQDSTCIDLLHDQGVELRFPAPRIATEASHGTGCTLSAAIAAGLALGHDLSEACAMAKEFINAALTHSLSWPSRNAPHIHALNQGTTPLA
jgi:hydroxymethylpyrimidine/phosphomethylpyrimidine kinase